jgi:putative selenate reductase molybdopterin-binding subunit
MRNRGAKVLADTELKVVSKRLPKVDGKSIVRGEARYTKDFVPEGALFAKIVRSPYAHARIKKIDAAEALAVSGVELVLTHEDVPRIPYTTAGQNYPEPSPYDTFMLDNKVRFVGDRVAVVVARDRLTAERAARLVRIEYETLPAVFDPEEALKEGAPVIHDEPDSEGIHDPRRNVAARILAQVGDIDEEFRRADVVSEHTYYSQYEHQTPMEPHVTYSYVDESGRLVIITATQVPFHVRRIVARVNQIPIARVRVIKPRVGGAFGVKQEIILEDLCGHIALRTGRPVLMELARDEEFYGTRPRHPMKLTCKTGVMKDGTIVANEMRVVANTGAYGSHGLTVPSNTGSKSLPLYRARGIRYVAEVAYTNLPVAGAFRGYGAPQGYFAMECHMDEVAHEIGMDALEFKRKNLIRAGDKDPIAVKLGEGKEGFERVVRTCGIEECIQLARNAVGGGGKDRRAGPGLQAGPFRRAKRGIGFALCMHGTGIPGDDIAGATIKVNEDGSFNLLVGATDLGTGSDTVLAQMAAEVLGVSLADVIVYSSDTDFTPFDVGAYASSTTYVSGTAVVRAAEKVLRRLREVAAEVTGVEVDKLAFENGTFKTPGGGSIGIREVALKSFYGETKQQISETASFLNVDCPPPFGACFAEVEVDLDTGKVLVTDIASAVDVGRAINPDLAEGQIVGCLAMGIGYALTEEMLFSPEGRMLNASLLDYKIPTSLDLPELKGFIVETVEPSGPFGVKSVGEVGMDPIAPAIANAIFSATGVRLRELPFTPEKVLTSLRAAGL